MNCKRCGKPLPSTGFICRNCGTLFDTDQIKEQKERINQENKDKIYHMSEFLPDGTPRKYTKEENPIKGENKALGLIIILVALCIVIVIALLKFLSK